MEKIKRIVVMVSVSVAMVGCATAPDKLPTTYVSPLKYKDYDCDQIIMEMDYVSKRTTDLYQSLDKKADNDAVQMGVGLILFWPALFLLEGGDGPEAQEYSNLRGEFEALRTAAVQKKCGHENIPKSPEEIIREKAQQEKKRLDKKSDDDV
ncbi:MAG TPA: metal ABC transporter ATP-binding protein [Thiotrichales bacterium]|nr:metal ABC transporter ATP-binding protein [Thiotrichales bacterium]